MQTPLKQTVMFADQVSTLGSTCSTAPLAPPAAPTRIAKGGAHDKRGYLNGLLIGLMGIVFGLGIMYLLSRLMQTTRKLALVERQLKQNQLVVEDIGLQMEFMRAPPAPAPRPVQQPQPQPNRGVGASAKPPPAQPQNATIPSPAALFDLSLPMSNLPMFFEVVMDASGASDMKMSSIEELEEVEEQHVADDAADKATSEAIIETAAEAPGETSEELGEESGHSPSLTPDVGDSDALVEQADASGADSDERGENEQAENEPAKRGRRKAAGSATSRQRKK